MKRTLNFTKRIGIDKKDISIEIKENNGDYLLEFNFNNYIKYKLDEYRWDNIYVDAYYRNEFKRFNFGNVFTLIKENKLTEPEDLSLNDFSNIESVKFRVVITDEQSHKIIASCDKINPKKIAGQEITGNEESLLPVRYNDIGQLIWYIEYQPDGPELIINRSIKEYRHVVKNNIVFRMDVYPQVLKEILTEIFLVKNHGSQYDDASDDWEDKWIRYAKSLNKDDDIPDIEDEDEYEYEDKIKEWIENAVKEFSQKFGNINKYNNSKDI